MPQWAGITNSFPSPFPPPSNFIFPAPLPVGTSDGSHLDMLNPLEYNWNLTFEHELAPGWLLRVAYVGSHGTHVRDYVDLNPAVYIPGSTLTDDQRRHFLTYSDITQPDYDANSHYNGGQLTLEKRFSQTGADRSQTGLNEDRGVQVGPAKGPGACGTKAPCVPFLNRNSFTLPAIGTFGNTGKNSIVGPNLIDWDMGIFKSFPFRERFMIQFRAEFFNVFNRVNFVNPSSSVSPGSFGTITSANDLRIGQLALKIFF